MLLICLVFCVMFLFRILWKYCLRLLSLSPVLSCGVRVVYFVIFCVFTFLVPCCGVRCDFHMKTMFYSSFPVACRMAHYIVVFVYVYWCPTCCSIICFSILNSMLWWPLRFRIQMMFGSSLLPDICRRADVLFVIWVCLCLTRVIRDRNCLLLAGFTHGIVMGSVLLFA